MRYIIGGTFVVFGAAIVYGGLTGRLPAMLAAIFKPSDLQPAAPASGKTDTTVKVLHVVSPITNVLPGIKTKKDALHAVSPISWLFG